MTQQFPAGLDYILPPKADWALLRGYCWDSLSSLYTFRKTFSPLRLGSGLPYSYELRFPRIHPVYYLYIATEETQNQSPVRLPVPPPGQYSYF